MKYAGDINGLRSMLKTTAIPVFLSMTNKANKQYIEILHLKLLYSKYEIATAVFEIIKHTMSIVTSKY